MRPLLAGGPGCLAVVTSRSSLAGLAATDDARLVRLGVLDEDEAMRMLEARLGRERVATEPTAVADLIRLCAGLPLALAVMAARAAESPDLPLAALAVALAGEPGRLHALYSSDEATSLRAVFSWSYRQLGEAAAQMFALLGLHCGPDISVPAAASLAGLPATGPGLRWPSWPARTWCTSTSLAGTSSTTCSARMRPSTRPQCSPRRRPGP